MPYASTRRLYHIFGKKVSKYFMYKKAKRLYNEISRELASVESKIIKFRGSNA